MPFSNLEDAVYNAKSLADPLGYVMQSGNLNELFNFRQVGASMGLLHYMALVKSKDGVSVMLDMGADPNLESSEGLTPLWTALIVEEFALIQLLVEKGADVNAREPRNGDTPLHSALILERQDIAQYLLDHGANPDARNNLGLSPRQISLFQVLRQFRK